MKNIIISKPEKLEKVKGAIVKDGKEKLHVLSDFDRKYKGKERRLAALMLLNRIKIKANTDKITNNGAAIAKNKEAIAENEYNIVTVNRIGVMGPLHDRQKTTEQ